jgi:hypothetical protein
MLAPEFSWVEFGINSSCLRLQFQILFMSKFKGRWSLKCKKKKNLVLLKRVRRLQVLCVHIFDVNKRVEIGLKVMLLHLWRVNVKTTSRILFISAQISTLLTD